MEKLPNIAQSEDNEMKVFKNLFFSNTQPSLESEIGVRITNKEYINGDLESSSGGFGVVYAVDVQIPGRDSTYPFV